MILEFKLWFENQIISFDFDSTMTKPYFDSDNGTWKAGDANNNIHHHHDNIDLMKQYAEKGYKIYIVTSRKQKDLPEVEAFVQKLGLPVERVVGTEGKNKGPILQELGVVIHHDDLEQKFEDPDGEFKGKWIKIYHPADGF
jgi:hypothetical protein